jgi:putative phosphoesterase
MAEKPGKHPAAQRATSPRAPRPAAAQRAPQRPAARRAPQRPAAPPSPVRIGVISDTHGYLDPRVPDLFAGVAHIIDAGDTMDPAIRATLAAVAPVTAVPGNLDQGELAEGPREASGEVAGVRFVVGHKRKRLFKRLAAGKITFDQGAAPNLIVFGHEHVPSAAWVDGVLHLNPGTASSPEEEDDGPTVAVVEVEPAGLAVRFIPLARRPHE